MLAMSLSDKSKNPALASQSSSPSFDIRSRLDFALHDLKQPLSAVRVLLECLQQEQGLPEDARDLVSGIEEAVGTITEQIQDLASSDLSEALPLQEIEVGEVVSAVRLWHRCLLERACIQIHGPQTPVRVRAHRGLLVRVLSNLFDNVLHHAESAKNVWVRPHEDDGTVRIYVRDDGPGWSRPFLHTERSRGLRFCAWALIQQGGLFTVGDGARGGEFILTLPAAGQRR